MALIYDHAPLVLPFPYNYNCKQCKQPVEDHATAWLRFLWRRGVICEHPEDQVSCIHGDAINAHGGKRRWCNKCHRAVKGDLPEVCSTTGKPHSDPSTVPQGRAAVSAPWQPEKPAESRTGPLRAEETDDGGIDDWQPVPMLSPEEVKDFKGGPYIISTPGLPKDFEPPNISISQFDEEDDDMTKKRTTSDGKQVSWFEVEALGMNMEQIERNAWNAVRAFGGEGASIVEHARGTAEPHGAAIAEGGSGDIYYAMFSQKFTFTVQRKGSEQ